MLGTLLRHQKTDDYILFSGNTAKLLPAEAKQPHRASRCIRANGRPEVGQGKACFRYRR